MLWKAVKTKVFDTFNSSKYRSMFGFKEAFSFHIPAEDFEQTLTEGPVWKLENIGVISDPGANRREPVLLKTKFLVQPGYTLSPELRDWECLFQGVKEVCTYYTTQLQSTASRLIIAESDTSCP